MKNSTCLHYNAQWSLTGKVRCRDCGQSWEGASQFAFCQGQQIKDLDNRLSVVTQQLHDMAAYLSVNFCDTCPELIGTIGETTAAGLTLSDPIEGDRAICKSCLLTLDERGDDLELTEERQGQIMQWIIKYRGSEPSSWPSEVVDLAWVDNQRSFKEDEENP
jgi:hypothetical protein